MSDMRIANTILAQLGGRRFAVITGSRDFVGDNNSLTMHLAKNASKANYLKITLDWDDTYTMEFYRFTSGGLNKKTFEWREPKRTTIKKLDGIYCDQLAEIFTETTGLYTSLF